MRLQIACVTALAALTASCVFDEFDPDVGNQIRERCINEDSDPETDVSYQRDIVEGVFRSEPTACLECHAPDAPTPFGFEVGGLDLSTYGGLRSGGAIAGSSVVVAGNPCDSVLVQKVREGVPFGGRMPLNGPPFLADETVQLLHDWIAEGANNN